MGFFLKKYTDRPIFIKEDSFLEKKVRELENLKMKGNNSFELEKELIFSKLGLAGEKEIEFELKNSDVGMYILRDVNIQYGDIHAQIDYIVITPAKTYFIECKNLIGNVTINERGEFIREYYINGKKIKEGFYSPLTQAERHIDIYHKRWKEDNKGLLSKYREKYFNKYNVPLVVMANSKNILNTKNAPNDIRNKIIKSDQLIRYLKEDIQNTNKDYLSDDETIKYLADKILTYTDDYKLDNLQQEINTISDNDIKQIIKEKLIQFRKKQCCKMNIPAFYVFTNEELDLILNYLPKTLNELANLNILSMIKVKIHGKDIIDIINKYSIENK